MLFNTGISAVKIWLPSTLIPTMVAWHQLWSTIKNMGSKLRSYCLTHRWLPYLESEAAERSEYCGNLSCLKHSKQEQNIAAFGIKQQLLKLGCCIYTNDNSEIEDLLHNKAEINVQVLQTEKNTYWVYYNQTNLSDLITDTVSKISDYILPS